MNDAKATKGSGGRNRRSGLSSFMDSRVGKICREFISDESGQGVLEYVLLLSGTVIGAGLLARGILSSLDSGILKLGGQLEKDLKTGRAPLTVYQN